VKDFELNLGYNFN